MDFLTQMSEFTSSPAWLGGQWIYSLVVIISYWKLFMKAGRPGWASIIPIYNGIVFIQIAGRPTWWILLFLIPFVNIIFAIIVLYDFLAKFGKGIGYLFGTIFLGVIFWPILAFDDSTYQGATPAQAAPQPGTVPPANPNAAPVAAPPSAPAPANPTPPAQPTPPSNDQNQAPPPANPNQ